MDGEKASPMKKKIFLGVLLLFLIFFIVVFLLIIDVGQGIKRQMSREAISNNLEEIISQLNTSQALIEFLNNNFSFKPKRGYQALTPQEFLKERRGGEQDFAKMAAYVLYQNNFISFILVYQYLDENGEESAGFITTFRDRDLPKYIYFDRQGAHLEHHGWSFGELCQIEERRLGVNIIKYAVLSPLAIELKPDKWVKERPINNN